MSAVHVRITKATRTNSKNCVGRFRVLLNYSWEIGGLKIFPEPRPVSKTSVLSNALFDSNKYGGHLLRQVGLSHS